MPERIVVSFRGFVPLRGEGGKGYLERAVALKQQADAFGANLCAWGSRTFSFDFGEDELEEAVSLALLAEAEHGVARRARFGVGIAHGEMSLVGEGGPLAVLSWGAGLVRSVALARIARAGEVLVDPRLPAVRRGDILTRSARVGRDAGGTIRGLTLDSATPWRREAAEAVSRLVEPPTRIGPLVAVDVQVPLGSLGLVRCAPGMGGTRLLRDWLESLRPTLRAAGGRCVLVSPVSIQPVATHPPPASLEPFSSLRIAIAASLETDGEVLLSPELESVADDLLGGRGGTVRGVAALLDAVVTGGGDAGALAIDVAGSIDNASLRAIAQAMVERGAFRALCRLDDQELLPRALAPVTLGPAWSVRPLSLADGARLARAFTAGALDDKAASLWARRGEGSPLAIREAIAESIATGELVWRADGLQPQRRSAGRGAPASAGHWILRRLARSGVDEREVLAAMAVIGRDATAEELGEVVQRSVGRTVAAAETVERLLASKWLARSARAGSGRVQLAADSCRQTLLRALSGPERSRRQHAAAEVIGRAAGPCELADGAWLALEGGDVECATAWAEVAVNHMAGLGLTADVDRLLQIFEAHGAGPVDRLRRASVPVSRPPPEPVDDELALLGDTQQAPAVATLLASAGVTEPEDSNLKTAETPIATQEVVSSQLAEAARRALLRGDVPGLDGAMRQLKSAGGKGDWVEMMSGLAALGRGAKEEALRTLRLAATTDGSEPSNARARLAYAVALGAVGRHEAALFEALAVLAAARESADKSGEVACVRLLSRLAHAAGHADAADVWSRMAEEKQVG